MYIALSYLFIKFLLDLECDLLTFPYGSISLILFFEQQSFSFCDLPGLFELKKVRHTPIQNVELRGDTFFVWENSLHSYASVVNQINIFDWLSLFLRNWVVF